MSEKKGVTVRWPDDLKQKIKERADANDTSFGIAAIQLVRKGLKLAEIEDAGAARAVNEYLTDETKSPPKVKKAQ